MNALAGPLLLVGSGKMGTALLGGWLDHGLLKSDVLVVEPADAGREAVSALGIEAVASAENIAEGRAFRAVVFAVKPQMMADVLPAYRNVVAKGGLVISIAAGTAIDRFEKRCSARPRLWSAPCPTRLPPSAKAPQHSSPTVVVSDHQRALAEALMAAVGDVHWLDSEAQMHGVTAMSGGGPAYVFLADRDPGQGRHRSGPARSARLADGANDRDRQRRARRRERGAGGDVLRKNVTSPGGTTQAALEVLMADDGIQPLFDQAIQAAAGRSTGAGLTHGVPPAIVQARRDALNAETTTCPLQKPNRARTAAPDLLTLAFEIIAETGWRGFTFTELADRAGLSMKEVRQAFSGRAGLLDELSRRLDQAMLGFDPADMEGLPPRDRVFELIISRLEAMAPFRAGLCRLMQDARFDPPLVAMTACRLDRSLAWLQDAAGPCGRS